MTRPLEALAPLADIASLTALALLAPMGMHIADAAAQAERDRVRLETKLQREQVTLQACEVFAINCLSGRKVRAEEDVVDCVKL